MCARWRRGVFPRIACHIQAAAEALPRYTPTCPAFPSLRCDSPGCASVSLVSPCLGCSCWRCFIFNPFRTSSHFLASLDMWHRGQVVFWGTPYGCLLPRGNDWPLSCPRSPYAVAETRPDLRLVCRAVRALQRYEKSAAPPLSKAQRRGGSNQEAKPHMLTW